MSERNSQENIKDFVNRINLLAEQDLDSSEELEHDGVFVIYHQSNEVRLEPNSSLKEECELGKLKEMEVSLGVIKEHEHELTSKGYAFVKGAMFSRFWKSCFEVVGIPQLKTHYSFKPDPKTVKHLVASSSPFSDDVLVNKDFNEDEALAYIDSVIAETDALTEKVTAINKKWDDFLKSKPVHFIPHVVSEEYRNG